LDPLPAAQGSRGRYGRVNYCVGQMTTRARRGHLPPARPSAVSFPLDDISCWWRNPCTLLGPPDPPLPFGSPWDPCGSAVHAVSVASACTAGALLPLYVTPIATLGSPISPRHPYSPKGPKGAEGNWDRFLSGGGASVTGR